MDGRLGAHYLRLRASMRPLLPGGTSSICIDGFPRSANSYAYYAFKVANPDAGVSGHCHSVSAIKRAIDLGVPVLLLTREPGPCVASLVQFVPGLSIQQAFGHYRRFHRRVADARSAVVVADFAEVTSGLGAVVDRVNKFAGTSFAPYSPTPDNEEAVRSQLDLSNRVYGDGRPQTLARPSDSRRTAEQVLGSLSRREAKRLAECAELHARLVSSSA